MAFADYFLCSVCEGKAFYDANLNYDWNEEPERRYRSDGYPLPCGAGNMHVLCEDCVQTHEIVVRPFLGPIAVSSEIL